MKSKCSKSNARRRNRHKRLLNGEKGEVVAKTIEARILRKKLERIENKNKKVKTLHNRFAAELNHERKVVVICHALGHPQSVASYMGRS